MAIQTTNDFGTTGWTPDRLPDLNGKTYVITGANSGAGYEAAKILLGKGAEVVMLNRSAEKSRKAIGSLIDHFGKQAKVSFIRLDLAELASVREAATEVLAAVPKIDALICNAAIAQVPTQQRTVEGFESHLGVNHYGHFLLVNRLFERISEASGRIVVVGSEGYKMGLKTIQFDDMDWDANYHPMNTYCHSKLAQIMFAFELQRRIAAKQGRAKVYVCHPGASATSLIKNSGGLRDRIIWGLVSKTPLVQSAKKGAYPEVLCATEDPLEQQAYYGPTKRMQTGGPVGACQLEPFALDAEVAARLWTISEEATGEAFHC
ncbi:SDR family oxidoreductase [Flagellimonas sp. DF-77]|uniref:SDR family oxidoreductase n=1 Tax=Flagellimonas algarum TaxID=3230298 RepID=UPI0033916D25